MKKLLENDRVIVAGEKTLNDYKVFDIRFNKRDRTHTELLEHGTGSAMMLELK